MRISHSKKCIVSMSKSIVLLLSGLLFLTLSLVFLILYLFYTADTDQRVAQKKAFVALSGVSDLALTNERYLRQRSLSSVFETYSIDGALREYDKESFVLRKGR